MRHDPRISLGALAAVFAALWCRCAGGAAEPWEPDQKTNTASTSSEPPPRASVGAEESDAASAGPDLLTADLQSVTRFGTSGGITAYGVGTTACNVGNARVNWISYTNQHPVSFENLYRLMDGRFEQIGMSWVWHGFYAVSEDFCGPCMDPTNGSQLGVGCSSPASAVLNGVQTNMGPRSAINAYNGSFPYPQSLPVPDSVISRRLQVHDADLAPTLNPGAIYFVEGQFIAADDALAGNALNNASYRRIDVVEFPPGTYSPKINSSFSTQVGQPAIRAWKDNDPDVVETDIQVPGEGLFILAAKATRLCNGLWHYEYALQNLNSHRSAGSFGLSFGSSGQSLQNVAFHDVDYHSGEVYDSADWIANPTDVDISWSTQSYSSNPNANALRFGTIYSFRFDASASPQYSLAHIGLFRPGYPTEISADTLGPGIDCDLCPPGVACCADGGCCDDQDACTDDSCDSGCCAQTPHSCPSIPCKQNTGCDPIAGCTYVDDCRTSPLGTCCPDDGNVCTHETCDASTGVCGATVDCTLPSDCPHDACTTASCTNSCCGTAPITCPSVPCKRNIGCDPSVGCTYVDDCRTGAHGTCCPDDGNVCTHETCDQATGACGVSRDCSAASDCNDGLNCTIDSCANSCCGHSELCPAGIVCCADGASCGDGDDCTEDSCVNGCCSHTVIPLCGLSIPTVSQWGLVVLSLLLLTGLKIAFSRRQSIVA